MSYDVRCGSTLYSGIVQIGISMFKSEICITISFAQNILDTLYLVIYVIFYPLSKEHRIKTHNCFADATCLLPASTWAANPDESKPVAAVKAHTHLRDGGMPPSVASGAGSELAGLAASPVSAGIHS